MALQAIELGSDAFNDPMKQVVILCLRFMGSGRKPHRLCGVACLTCMLYSLACLVHQVTYGYGQNTEICFPSIHRTPSCKHINDA